MSGQCNITMITKEAEQKQNFENVKPLSFFLHIEFQLKSISLTLKPILRDHVFLRENFLKEVQGPLLHQF